MDKLFHDKEPNNVQYQSLYREELIRLVKSLEDRSRRQQVCEYSKEDLIKLCRAYYAFLRVAPKMKEPKEEANKLFTTEYEDEDLKLIIPIFKKNVQRNHINDSKVAETASTRKPDSGDDDGDWLSD